MEKCLRSLCQEKEESYCRYSVNYLKTYFGDLRFRDFVVVVVGREDGMGFWLKGDIQWTSCIGMELMYMYRTRLAGRLARDVVVINII